MIANLIAVLFILFVIWWFWLAKPRGRQARAREVLDVVVEGGSYTPARIELAETGKVILRFIRRDPNPCAEKVIFPELGLSYDLPLDEPVQVELEVPAAGEYQFHCQMGMYRGQLKVAAS